MTLLLNPTYLQNDTAEICQDALPYTWRDTLIAEQQPSTTTHSLHRSTAAGCDSIHALRLTVDSVYYTLVPVVSCQPFTWIDSVTYSEPVVVSVTLASEAGCDSVVTLQLQTPLPAETHLVDTFCAGAVYRFAGRGLTDGGLFVDSLHTEEGCDSLVYLHLKQLPLPTPTIVAEIDCGEGLYRIHAEVDVPWFEWTTTGGVWSDDWGDPQAADLAFNPSQYRELLLVADYGEIPQCPDTAHMDLYPVVTPEAVMHLSPLMTTPDNNVIEMVSESRHASIHRWYVDEVFWDEGIATSYRVPIESDSTTVMLVASGEVCSDTAVAVVPMHKVALFAPSVFTPSQGIEENRYFRIVTREVEEMEIHIYNRNGLLVFHSTDLDFRWDGTNLGGKPCPQAAYVYHLHYRDKANPGQWHTYDGTVTLLR